MIYALALASNVDCAQNLAQAQHKLAALGPCQISQRYQIPCRDGIGADYWNMAMLITSDLGVDELISYLKQLEQQAGRSRPSYQIPLDIDLIGWGADLTQMQFNPKKLPLVADVSIPLAEVWPQIRQLDPRFEYYPDYPMVV